MMNKRALNACWILFQVLILAGLNLKAQISTNELPLGIQYGIDNSKLIPHKVNFDEQKIDEELNDGKFPMLAGVSLPVDLEFSKKAVRSKLADGTVLWQMKINVPGAKYLGVVFSDFYMQAGDKFFIYDASGKNFIGAFTHENNADHGYFSTHILPSSNLILEYVSQNTSSEFEPEFIIDEMIYVLPEYAAQLQQENEKSSGLCNVNINCPEGFLWQKQKRGVARIFLRAGNSWFNCTGTLINNTAIDKRAYFLTADHCGSSATLADFQVWQFYFNYEYATCSSTGSAPQNMMLTGAELRAKAPISQGTDFKLLELNQRPPDSWNPYYNGWIRSSINPEKGVVIHHPLGDAKKISTYTAPLTSATFTGGIPQAYWRVLWDSTATGHGVTEAGSSGSPLFSPDGLVTGTLTGGSASCNSPNLPDFFGKFYMHWQANGESSDKSLKSWLDPLAQNPEYLYGFDPNAATNFVIVEATPSTGGVTSGAGYYASNESVILAAKPNEGYYFLHWKNQSNQIVSLNTIYSFSMPQTEVFLTAVFDVQNAIPEDQLPLLTEISPNPASDHINLHFKNSSGTAQLRIFNIHGQIISQFEIHDTQSPTNRIDLNGLKNGVYILSIMVGSNISNYRIIVTK